MKSATIRQEMEHVIMIHNGSHKMVCHVNKVHKNGNISLWYRGILGTIHIARKDKSNFPYLNLKNWLTGRFESFMVRVY